MGLVKAAKQEFDEAIQLHQKSIELNPKDMMVYYHLGSALEKKGRIQEAVEAYRTALKKFNELYPAGTDNKNAAEFEKTIKTAITQIETRL